MARPPRTAILLPLLAFAVLLAGIEVGVRMRLPHFASRDFFLTLFDDPPDGTPPDQQPLFAGDPVLFWRLRGNVDHAVWDFTMVSTNAQGLRHDRPIEDKPAGRFRIVCVGDSVTFGYRIPLVFPDAPEHYDRNDAPYAGRLERMLRAQYPGRDVEVIALAVPGFTSFQGRLLLEQTIGWLEPDVVILSFGFNDVAQRPRPDAVVMAPDLVSTTLRRVLSSSQALLHLWRWYDARAAQRPAVEQPTPGERVSRLDYVANMDAMVQLAAEHGAAVLVVGAVYRDRTTNPPEARRMSIYRGTLQEAMRLENVPFLQIDELTENGAPANDELFGEHIHPSSNGHQLMAERILAALAEHGMLQPLGERSAAPG
ncbi:MAG: SGNH/GDSL hydrolase family protein [Deltaproteobacteria bacterium]|nr:SGNH/GDSL hydrolase family protein [Deltaproteobacteria bacterium]